MSETIFARLADDGQLGAHVTVYTERRPSACPGLGGWKGEPGEWWTRVKGQPAADLLAATSGAGNPYAGLRLGPRGIIEAVATLPGDDIMDDDLAEAHAAGRLNWRAT